MSSYAETPRYQVVLDAADRGGAWAARNGKTAKDCPYENGPAADCWLRAFYRTAPELQEPEGGSV